MLIADAIPEFVSGAYSMSIGTSLALEGLFGIYPDRPENPPPVEQYRTLWVNIDTVIRNTINAYNIRDYTTIVDKTIADRALLDVQMIDQTVKESGYGLKVMFYRCDYEKLKVREPQWLFTTPQSKNTTALSIHMSSISMRVAQRMNGLVHLENFNVQVIDPTLIITHQPWDLMSQSNRSSIALLESHTGKLKLPGVWHTKINSPIPLPFLKSIMAICGDKTLIAPHAKLKRQMMKVAKAQQWTPLTSLGKVLADCKRAEVPELVAFIERYR